VAYGGCVADIAMHSRRATRRDLATARGGAGHASVDLDVSVQSLARQDQLPVGGTRIATTSRENHGNLYYNASDTESDRGEDDDDEDDWPMVYDDDDWRAFT
jgi:hypothetical protein